MPKDLSVTVERNHDLGHGNLLLEVMAPEIAAETRPGQFFMIGIPGAEVLLRRPFSVCGIPGTFEGEPPGAVHVLYRVAGRGTTLLSALKPGSPVTLLGPLGRGFGLDLEPDTEPVLVAGGIGSAPFPAVVSVLAAAGFRPTLFYGARSAADLPLLDWFRERCRKVVVTTEDGSAGERGIVTAPLREHLAREGRRKLFACGPNAMLKAVADVAREAGAPCEVSLEAHMACGFGVCLGCVVPTRGPDGTSLYERVCVEGPVMPAERLAW